MKKYLKEILYLLGDDRKKLPFLVILFLGSSILDLAGIGLIGPYVALVVDPDSIQSGTLGDLLSFLGVAKEQEAMLVTLGFALFVIFMLKAISALIINYMIIRFSQNQQVRLRSYLMQTYQSMPFTEYLRRNSSEYIYSIQSLTGQFSSGVVLIGLRTLSDAIVAVAIFAMLVWSNAMALTLLVGLLGPMVLGYDRMFRRKLRGYGLNTNRAATSMVQGIHEGVEGLKEIRVLGKESYFHNKVKTGAERYGENQTKYQLISTAPRYLMEFLMISFVVLLVVGTVLLDKDLSKLLPTLGIFGVAALRLLPITNVFANSLLQLRYTRDAVSRLYTDFSALEKIEVQTQAFKKNPNGIFDELSIQHISLTYPGTNRKALKHITLKISAGESVGFIGKSGSGKTTLIDTLLGLLSPQEGEILYNNTPLNDVLAEWRSQIAYLPQQVFLIDNSLRCNVALGIEDNKIDEIRLEESLRQARLDEFVKELPDGVDTILGERGVRLSGGQRQRVALARAFYHGRNILVMDEATSALDNETEKEIVEEIKQLKGLKTMIVIAHRLTTVKYCNHIYRLEGGCIVENGEPEQVLGNRQGVNTL